MPRSGKAIPPPPAADDYEQTEDENETGTETETREVDPKTAQRLAALKKAQASRMAKAELKRKEKAVADFESTQRKEEISRKFDELQERLGKKPKAPTPPTPKADDEPSDDEEPVAVKPKQSKAYTSKKTAPKKPKKKVVVQEESSSSESEEEVVVKRKKKSKPKRRVVYETETDSEDEYVNHVRSTAAAYYQLMFLVNIPV